jgi:hypothetical protein
VHLQFKFTKVQIPSPITGLRDDLMLTFEDVRVSATENRTRTQFSAGLLDCRRDRRWIFFSESGKSFSPEVVQLPEIRPPPVHHIPLEFFSQSQASRSNQWWCNCRRHGHLLYITYSLNFFLRNCLGKLITPYCYLLQ